MPRVSPTVSPKVSIVVPANNAAETIAETIRSLLAQSFADFELIAVDDESTDATMEILQSFDDPRLRVLWQFNRGLAGAHNTGIAAAQGEYIGFCDADDLWTPDKLAAHVAHLDARPEVGISYSGSALIGPDGAPTGLAQHPRLTGVDAAHVLKRNPIGNGSAAVIRREALDALRHRPENETVRDRWFDETFRQSDDIEGWTRFAVSSDYRIEGIPGLLTLYRVNPHGLSANIDRQLESWERMLAKLARIAPDLVVREGAAARAYQHRYLLRRAITARDARAARKLMRLMAFGSAEPMALEPVKTLTTFAAGAALLLAGGPLYSAIESGLFGLRKRFPHPSN